MKYKLLFIIVAGSLYTSVWGFVTTSGTNNQVLMPKLDIMPIKATQLDPTFKPTPGLNDVDCGIGSGLLDPSITDVLNYIRTPLKTDGVTCPQVGLSNGDITAEFTNDNFRYWKLKEVCDCYASKHKVLGLTSITSDFAKEDIRKRTLEKIQAQSRTQQNSLMFQASFLYPNDPRKTQEVSQLYNLSKQEDAPGTLSGRAVAIVNAAINAGRNMAKALTQSNANQCLPMREFLAYKSIPKDPAFYTDIKGTDAFNPKDWNFESLKKELQSLASKSGKTSMDEVLSGPDSQERKIMRKLEFLSANPLYKNLFLSDGSNKPKIKTAQEKLFKSIHDNYSKCGDVKCVMGKRNDVLKTEREIFTDPDVAIAIQAQAELFRNIMIADIQTNKAAQTYIAPSPEVNVLVTKSEEQMMSLDGGIDLLKKSCQDVQSFMESSRDFTRDLADRLNSVLELDEDKNTEYKKLKDALCNQPRTRKDGKETLTFNEYLTKRNKSNRTVQNVDILADYISDYRGHGESPELPLLETFLRKNPTGGVDAQTALNVASQGMSQETARKLTNEVDLARRVMLDKDSKELIASNPELFGGAPSAYSSPIDSKTDNATPSRLPASISEDAPVTSSATPSSDSSFSSPLASATPGLDNFNVNPTVAPVRSESAAVKPSSDSSSENDVAHSSQASSTPVSARERELETRLATLESELDKSKKAEQTSDYKKILEELEALKAQRAQDAAKAAEEASEVAQTDRQVRSHSSAISSGSTPAVSQGTNSVSDRAPASISAPAPSSYSSAVANLAPLSASSGALAGSYQKALNDRYKISASTPGVIVKEGEFAGKVTSSEGSTPQATSSEFALNVSQELYTALASANPVSAQATFQKELQGQFKSLSDRPLGSIVAIKSGASTTLKFMVVKLNDQVYFEPIRVSTLRGLRENLNSR